MSGANLIFQNIWYEVVYEIKLFSDDRNFDQKFHFEVEVF